MMTRAKFYCTSVLKTLQNAPDKDGKYSLRTVFAYKFQVVSSGSEENKNYFASTPSGSIELSALREDLFEIGKEYYLDFTPASKE
jgi:hypothetical protein